MKKIFLLISCFLFVEGYTQQSTDSNSAGIDTSAYIGNPVNTLPNLSLLDSIKPFLQYSFTNDSFLYRKRLFFSFTDPVRYTVSEKQWEGKENIFYSIIALLICFALIKNNFSRYLTDVFSSYFRTTIRQKQIKEQLLQSPLPSLLFNSFFVISTAVFLSLLLEHFHPAMQFSFWLLAFYIALGLIILYAGKFVLLKFVGWVFQLTEAVNTYIFVVFSTNKVMGIALLPFSVMLAFSYGLVNEIAVTLSLIVIGLLFVYRYFLSYLSINRTVQINLFHFLLYLCAFEILPLLLINKLLLRFVSEIA